MAGDLDASNEAMEPVPVRQPLLARVPEWVVPLGAGGLATSTLLTLVGLLYVGYSILDGQFFGYQPYQMYLAALQFAVATIFQSLGVHFARQRVRWTWVMLAAALGSLAIITVPFTLLAIVCIGLGKYHFMAYTPSDVVKGEKRGTSGS